MKEFNLRLPPEAFHCRFDAAALQDAFEMLRPQSLQMLGFDSLLRDVGSLSRSRMKI